MIPVKAVLTAVPLPELTPKILSGSDFATDKGRGRGGDIVAFIADSLVQSLF